jgi:hypothetical protein
VIKYALVCDAEHEFESWFPGSDAFDKLARRGLVSCPICQSTKVDKAIMAPRLARTDRERRNPPGIEGEISQQQGDQSQKQPVALLDEKAIALREAIRELRTQMLENSVDVGERFTTEARRMHDGEIPSRSIRGQATIAEARELIEEGIPLLPIPDLPDDRH